MRCCINCFLFFFILFAHSSFFNPPWKYSLLTNKKDKYLSEEEKQTIFVKRIFVNVWLLNCRKSNLSHNLSGGNKSFLLMQFCQQCVEKLLLLKRDNLFYYTTVNSFSRYLANLRCQFDILRPQQVTLSAIYLSVLHCTVLQWLTLTLKADIFIIATTQHLSSLLSCFTLIYPNVKLHNANYCQTTKYTVYCYQTVTSSLLSGTWHTSMLETQTPENCWNASILACLNQINTFLYIKPFTSWYWWES